MLITVLALALTLSPGRWWQAPAADAAEANSTAKALGEVFVAADLARLKEHFAERVQFAGDLRFVSRTGTGQVEITRDELAAAYERLFNGVGRDRWTTMMKATNPAMSRAAKDAEKFPFVKAGEYIYELRLAGRTGADDVIVFVLRRIDGKFRVVGHWADY
jgi:hypothetical protein